MAELGVEKVFIDRISGKNTDRPELKEMMGFVRCRIPATQKNTEPKKKITNPFCYP